MAPHARVAERMSPHHDILPIFLCEQTDAGPLQPVAFLGTGFRLAHLLITCWHCVSEPPPERHVIAALIALEPGRYKGGLLKDLTQDENGSDLALAHLITEFPSRLDIDLASQSDRVEWGTDVWTWGFPLTRRLLGPTGTPTFHLEARYLQGYVTRAFHHEVAGYGEVPSFELDLHAPEGLSGAPLIRAPSPSNPRAKIVGVVYGRSEVHAIEEFASIDPQTGDRRPEVLRLVSFALAHLTPTLLEAKGPATWGRPVGEIWQAWRASLPPTQAGHP